MENLLLPDMKIDTTFRAQDTEIMDDFSLKGEELRDALDKIAGINKVLGGNKLTLKAVKKLIGNRKGTITILDIGCGNGDMLRMLSGYGTKHNLDLGLIGVDANQFTVNYAEELSEEYKNITYKCINIFSEEFTTLDYDIALCTLTLHHFTDEEILKLLELVYRKAAIGVVVNDLHRSKAAYSMFRIICFLFGLNRMSKEDGLVSIRKGFKEDELRAFSQKLGLRNFSVNWRWAFRYEWIIYKI